MEIKKVVCDKVVLSDLEDIFEYLKPKPEVSSKIVPTIVKFAYDFSNNFEIYSLDRFKVNNDGSYRAFEKYHYRVSYRVLPNEIRILRIRHTSINPKGY
jgi:plasmid stabilization system protein ParE